MAKAKTIYVCAECGASSPRWLGRCTQCNAWNSMSEEREHDRQVTRLSARADRGRAETSLPMSDVTSDAARRIHTGIGELDRVLGGGLVAGGVVLVGGDPGIGKSSLLLQALAGVAASGRAHALCHR